MHVKTWSVWIVYNYSITLSSEGEMILWQPDVTGIRDQSNTLIKLWDGLKPQLKEEVVQQSDTIIISAAARIVSGTYACVRTRIC